MQNGYLKYYLLLLLALPVMLLNAQDISLKNGVNIQASYYNNGFVNMGWSLMKQYPEIGAVRIEIEPDRASQASQWIREAQTNGYQVIATYHRARQIGSNTKSHLIDAANWWVRHYAQFTTTGPITINLMNEWGGHDISAEEYADAYNEAIGIIRSVYDGPIIIDLPGFGHNINLGLSAYPLLKDNSLIYSLHIYPTSVNVKDDSWVWVKDLDALENANINWIVGEFGANGTGGTNWCGIVEYAYQKNRPIFGWAWNGDGGTMNMVSPSWSARPRASEFEPTVYLERIVSSLSGTPCFTKRFNGVEDFTCTPGAVCNDNNDFTINDQFNESCVCIGTFTSALSPNSGASILLNPNPTQQVLNINFVRLSLIEEVAIFNINGQKIKNLPYQKELKSLSVEVQGLPKGTYLLVAFLGGNKKAVGQKFIKL